jgi:hypothetical protein
MAYRSPTWAGRLRTPLALAAGNERLLWTMVVVGFVADSALTAYGLHVGFYEFNPVVRASIGLLGVVGGLIAVKAVAVAVALVVNQSVSRRYQPLVPAVLATPWLLAAGVNAVGLLG